VLLCKLEAFVECCCLQELQEGNAQLQQPQQQVTSVSMQKNWQCGSTGNQLMQDSRCNAQLVAVGVSREGASDVSCASIWSVGIRTRARRKLHKSGMQQAGRQVGQAWPEAQLAAEEVLHLYIKPQHQQDVSVCCDLLCKATLRGSPRCC
jgi:hypothetical protein